MINERLKIRPGSTSSTRKAQLSHLVACLILISCNSFAFPPTVVVRQQRSSKYIAGRLYADKSESIVPLAVDGDWAAYKDYENTGLVYYFNSRTDESIWEKPYPSFPDIEDVDDDDGKDKEESEKESFSFNLPNVFASAVADEIDNSKTTSVVKEVEETDNKEPEVSGKTGFLSGLFGNASESDEIVEKEAFDEPNGKDESTLDEVETNIFSNLFKTTASDDSAEELPSEDVTEIKEENISKAKSNSEGTNMFSNIFTQLSPPSNPSKIDTEEVVEVEESMPQTVGSDTSVNSFFSNMFKSSISNQSSENSNNEVSSVDKTAMEPVGLEVSSRVLPHPEKVSWGGEDALFSSGRTFGVFDGVSGAEKEYGKALFSVTLAQQFKLRCDEGGKTMKRMLDIMNEVSDIAEVQATGASTALVANVGEDNILRVLNIGDCKLIVVRDGVVAYKTRETVHYFDCPYQLSYDSPDQPRDGAKMQVELMKGDIIVAGSDGIFDNLTEKQICRIINENLWASSSASSGLTNVTNKIVNEARRISLDNNAETPYSKVARKHYEEYSDGLGGKLDDVSCLLARCT